MQALEKPSVESGQGTDPAEESLLFAGGGKEAGFQRDSLQIYFAAPVPLCRINAGVGGASVRGSVAAENLIRKPHLGQLELGSLRAGEQAGF